MWNGEKATLGSGVKEKFLKRGHLNQHLNGTRHQVI